jgi:cob(I)alamin adenosyltransferase
MKIYTKTGDKGETGLWGGGRVGKDDIRIDAYGTVDECNAVLGIARSCEIDGKLDEMLAIVQNLLFVVGSDLATPADIEPAIPRIGESDVTRLEKWIDQLEDDLPKLKNFIVPGGTPAAAHLHHARTVCRRAERLTVALCRDNETGSEAKKFLNRLSDFLFVAARTANHRAGIEDLPWESPRLKKE